MKQRSLCVLLTSHANGVHLYPLFFAAERKNVQLAIHLQGEGVRLCLDEGYRQLLARTHFSICRPSAERLGIADRIRTLYPHALLSGQRRSISIRQCAKFIVL